jgi:hypothetical protein
MKWFKHMTDASEDAFLEELEELFGWEGYGRWWKLLEKIGKEMDETDNCYAQHSWVKWQSFLKGKRNKLELFLIHCQNKEKIKLEQNGNMLKIICPKLLELRDEYSRKSGRSPDKKPDKLPPKKEEERIKKEEKCKSNSLDLQTPSQPSLMVVGVLEKGKGWDIINHLTDKGFAAARLNAPEWDIYYLARVYNEKVPERGIPKIPDKAFAGWCLSYTKGKPPSYGSQYG